MVTRILIASIIGFAAFCPSAAFGRKWTDETGKFSIEAELVKQENGVATLRKPGGEEIAVPVDKLSTADRQYLASLAKPAPAPATPMANPATPTPKPPAARPAAKPDRMTRDKLDQVWSKKVAFDFENVALVESLNSLQSSIGVNIVLDTTGLKDSGIDDRTPVTFKSPPIDLEVGLSKMLSPLKLVCGVRDDVLYITNAHHPYRLMETRVYRLIKRVDNLNSLIDDIQTKVHPTEWDEAGGAGGIEGAFPNLVVSQYSTVQREIASRYSEWFKPVVRDANQVVPVPKPEWASIVRTLEQPTQMDFLDASLRDVAKHIAARHKIKVELTEELLDEFGIGPILKFNLNLTDVRLSTALALLLEPAELSYAPIAGGIEITTRDDERARIFTASYPVQDLVRQQANPGSVPDFDSLIELVEGMIAPTTWEDVGGTGTIVVAPNGTTVEISQSFSNHLKIMRLLADMRAPLKP